MSKQNDTLKTVLVAGILCIVCSIFVSSVVVMLRPQQAKNAEIDVKKNILVSAGIIKAGASIEEIETAFEQIETVIVDMETGQKVEGVTEFDQVKASKNPKTNIKIPAEEDVAGLSRRSKLAKVFLKRDGEGTIQTVIFNFWSKGLWSTMYGFVALADDVNTVKGFAYYSHGETPGLGGEVDNPRWKASWIGKKIYGEEGSVKAKVAKGEAKNKEYEVDGLSGATITANGVSSSLKYWFGAHGYKDVIENIKTGGL